MNASGVALAARRAARVGSASATGPSAATTYAAPWQTVRVAIVITIELILSRAITQPRIAPRTATTTATSSPLTSNRTP